MRIQRNLILKLLKLRDPVPRVTHVTSSSYRVMLYPYSTLFFIKNFIAFYSCKNVRKVILRDHQCWNFFLSLLLLLIFNQAKEDERDDHRSNSPSTYIKMIFNLSQSSHIKYIWDTCIISLHRRNYLFLFLFSIDFFIPIFSLRHIVIIVDRVSRFLSNISRY